jgi:hypothetical protein
MILEEKIFKRGNTIRSWTTNESQTQPGVILTFTIMTIGKIGELLFPQSLLDIIII